MQVHSYLHRETLRTVCERRQASGRVAAAVGTQQPRNKTLQVGVVRTSCWLLRLVTSAPLVDYYGWLLSASVVGYCGWLLSAPFVDYYGWLLSDQLLVTAVGYCLRQLLITAASYSLHQLLITTVGYSLHQLLITTVGYSLHECVHTILSIFTWTEKCGRKEGAALAESGTLG